MDPANLYIKLDAILAQMRDPTLVEARAHVDSAMLCLWGMLSVNEKKLVISRLTVKDSGSDGD